ncbi:MAG TPA: DUF2911 domain-containing protein [Flavisolibacter sp.]|nr:DUF2911 domain-containing protein [Flavisolibacter sp.]
MKKGIITTLLIICTVCGFAQTQAPLKIKLSELDKSPMDMAYFPADYPVLKIKNKTTQSPVARVIYSRPQVDNRVIFGELIEYNKVWRLGANEATEIEFFKDVTINGKKVPKGRYTLYAIPNPDQWTVIINKDTDTWGAFVYNDKKDVLRVDVPVQKLADPAEVFTMSFDKTDTGANLFVAWEKVSITLPITIK